MSALPPRVNQRASVRRRLGRSLPRNRRLLSRPTRAYRGLWYARISIADRRRARSSTPPPGCCATSSDRFGLKSRARSRMAKAGCRVCPHGRGCCSLLSCGDESHPIDCCTSSPVRRRRLLLRRTRDRGQRPRPGSPHLPGDLSHGRMAHEKLAIGTHSRTAQSARAGGRKARLYPRVRFGCRSCLRDHASRRIRAGLSCEPDRHRLLSAGK